MDPEGQIVRGRRHRLSAASAASATPPTRLRPIIAAAVRPPLNDVSKAAHMCPSPTLREWGIHRTGPTPVAIEDDETVAHGGRACCADRAAGAGGPRAIAGNLDGDTTDTLDVVRGNLPHFPFPDTLQRRICRAGRGQRRTRYGGFVARAANRGGGGEETPPRTDGKSPSFHRGLPR